MGLWAGWPSWALNAQMPKPGTPAEWISTNDHGWTVSLFDLTNVACAWPAALLAYRLGRRGCLLVIGMALVSSFAVLYIPGTYSLFIGRILAGIAKAVGLCTTPAFLGEIAQPDARGKMNVAVACCDALGMLAAMVAGPLLPYTVMNSISLAMAILFLVAVMRVPETPVFLLSRGRPAEARQSHLWYQPDNTAAAHDEQLARMQRRVREDMAAPGTFRTLFMDTGNRVALALVLGAIVAQRGGGITCVMAYSTNTLPNDGPVIPDNVAVTFAVVRLVFTLAAVPLIDRCGRRPLLIGSHFGCAVVCAIYAWFLHTADGSVTNGWMLCLCVVMYVVVYSVGAGSVPGALLGEMFPVNVKSHAVTVINIVSSFGSFVSTKLYLSVSEAFGAAVMYVAFCVINVAWALCAYLFLFETNGMTLSAIQDVLDGYKTHPVVTDQNNLSTGPSTATTPPPPPTNQK